VVLEANQVAWGCSSRSGGQGQNASGRLKRSQWIARWGRDVALKLDAEIREGFETFRSLTQRIDCDATDGGHLYVAHRPKMVPVLARECAVMREVFGYGTRMLSAQELQLDHCNDRDAAGAMHEPEGIGIHPLKFSYGLMRQARELGVRVHTASPVTKMHQEGSRQVLVTPGGRVRAARVAVCTGERTASARLIPAVLMSLTPMAPPRSIRSRVGSTPIRLPTQMMEAISAAAAARNRSGRKRVIEFGFVLWPWTRKVGTIYSAARLRRHPAATRKPRAPRTG
jgi:glycine/D-amino acid oxidase-like deaminating enzyme